MRRRNGYLFRIAGLVGDVVRARIVLSLAQAHQKLRSLARYIAALASSQRLCWRAYDVPQPSSGAKGH
jgi:hypothetical protein